MSATATAEGKCNGLFDLRLRSETVTCLVCGPIDCELTGPTLSPDGRGLLVSVQHRGRSSKADGRYTSHWPDGGAHPPRPAVVQLRGSLLEKLLEA